MPNLKGRLEGQGLGFNGGDWRQQSRELKTMKRSGERSAQLTAKERHSLAVGNFDTYLRPIFEEIMTTYGIPNQDPYTRGVIGELLDAWHLYGESPNSGNCPQRPGLDIREMEDIIRGTVCWGIGRSEWGWTYWELEMEINYEARCKLGQNSFNMNEQGSAETLEDAVVDYIKKFSEKGDRFPPQDFY